MTVAEPENIDVRCVTCKTEFVTAQDSFDAQEGSCPKCGGKKLAAT